MALSVLSLGSLGDENITDDKPMLHGVYTALTETGWNEPGDNLKPGEEGLVGGWWGELIVGIDFEEYTAIKRIVNNFHHSVEVSVSTDGKDWLPIMTLPPGATEVQVISRFIRVDWKITKGPKGTIEFYGHLEPNGHLVYTELWLAGPPERELVYENIHKVNGTIQKHEKMYKLVGEGTLISENNKYFRTAQYKNLGSSVEEVLALVQRNAYLNKDCVGFHINTVRGGRYLQAALLMNAAARWPPVMPAEFQEKGAEVAWIGFFDSVEMVPRTDIASTKVGKGWGTWTAYSVDRFAIILPHDNL